MTISAQLTKMRSGIRPAFIVPTTIVAMLAACSTPPDTDRSVRIQRTTYGVAHIEAADYELLAYGIAYAHAQDNVCQTANQLVTIRGERSRFFGPNEQALLGLRMLPNEQIDIFVRAHMDDAALEHTLSTLSPEARSSTHGYVKGYNRFLRDNASHIAKSCVGESWIRPMTEIDFLRLQELTMVQLGVALMADAMTVASPPLAGQAFDNPVDPAQAVVALAPYHLKDTLLGSNGWAFGSEVTTNGRGALLGNPHFPWAGVNRFWQMHLTIPGQLDVMGAAIGHSPAVQIGFNKDVAWTHTVSTGRRFTLHELQLVPGEPTRYLVDGKPLSMSPTTVSYEVRDDTGTITAKEHTIWRTRFGPVIVIPRAGLDWSDTHAYALQDANTLNLRALEIWLGLNTAQSISDMRKTLGRLGVPWVNTIAADRNGEVMYADVSVVPDVPNLDRCAPSEGPAGLFRDAGLVVLDGSRSDCDWQRDPSSPVPGLIPIERMPVATRRDWVQNSNDSYWLTNPDIDWLEHSVLIGATRERQSLRTRSGVSEIRERLAADDGIAEHGKVGLHEIQSMLFANRNQAARLVLDDLLAACDAATTTASRNGCSVLADWDRRDNLESRGAHLFREWWRVAKDIDMVWREPFDPDHPIATPSGLNTNNATIRSQLLTTLDDAVETVISDGFALDAPLGEVQGRLIGDEVVGLHGGPEFEGLLNKLEALGTETLPPEGYRINFGSSYIQTVTFDEHGPVAEAIPTYGQSSHADYPFSFDQLQLYAGKKWQALPFHPADVAKARIGNTLQLDVN